MPLNDTPAIRRRLLAVVLTGALVAPSPAFAQGAGDDQYKDPFPETTAQDAQSGSSTSTSSQGLSQTPPSSTTEGSSSSGSTGSTSGASAGTTAAGDTSASTTTSQAASLARTGDDPWLIALAGASLLLLGAGLRLRSGAQRRH